MLAYHDEWIKNFSAGGSGNNGDKRFWQNPQFLLKLVDADLNYEENLATVIISLMQKFTKQKRRDYNGEPAEEFIQFRLYKVRCELDAEYCAKNSVKLSEYQLERIDNSGGYINKREITKRFRVEPGFYVIVPSLFDYNATGQFLLRIFTEQIVEQKHAHALYLSPSYLDQARQRDLFLKSEIVKCGIKSMINVLGDLLYESKNNDSSCSTLLDNIKDNIVKI